MFPTAIAKEKIDLFLSDLRHATSPMHQRLEESHLSINLLKPDASLQDYTRYLERMHDVIAFCETTVFPLIAFLLPDLNERKKLQLLENDLSFFERVPREDYSFYEPFEKADIGFALGYMYVIEGSTLGGRVILKQLASQLPINESAGGSFFAGYKEETGSKWKTFLAAFAIWAIENNRQEEVIRGAQHAFETIYKHFE